MSKKIAVVHTGPVTVDPIKNTFAALAPELEIVNIVDDSLLKDAMAVGHVTSRIVQRMCWYFGAAEQLGADVVFNACSTVGEASDIAAATIGIPVIKVDEAMAREAASIGERIALIATVPTTIGPSSRLIEKCARAQGKAASVKSTLCSTAFELLLKGDKAGHDNAVIEEITKASREADVVVLAQVSMARLLSSIPDTLGVPVLASLELGVKDVISFLARQAQ
jgi:Asp/Glu/hydantoin racemase